MRQAGAFPIAATVLAALALALVNASGGLAAEAAADAKPACPNFTPAQIKSALGVKPVSLLASTSTQPDTSALDCFYTLGADPSLVLLSLGPYHIAGPTLAQLLAFARLLVHSGYGLVG